VYGDPTQDRRDSFGRLLAYVKTRGGPQLNIAQVRRGWAKVFVFQANPFRQTASFRRAAKAAKRQRRGVWGRCGGDFDRRVRSTAARVAIRCRSINVRNVRDGRTRYKVYRSRGSRSCLRARRVMRRWAFNVYRVARARKCRTSTCSNARSPQGYRCHNGSAGAEIRSGFVQECRRGRTRFQSYTR
jgi:hypothetical protein